MDRSIFITITVAVAILLVLRVTLRNRKKPKEESIKSYPYEAYHVENNLCIFKKEKRTQLITVRGKILKKGHLYILHLPEPIGPQTEEVTPLKVEDYKLVNGFKLSLNTAEALRRKAPKETKIIDLRREAKYREGHLPGAINIPIKDLSDSLGEMGKNDILIFYSEKAGDVSEAIEALNREMYTTLLDGGHIKDYTGTLERA